MCLSRSYQKTKTQVGTGNTHANNPRNLVELEQMKVVDLPKLLLLLAVDADQVGVIHSTGDLRRALDVLVLEKLETFGVLQ